MVKGLTSIVETQAKERQKGNTLGLFLTLRDGDAATIRFITDADDFVSEYYHNGMSSKVSKNGKRIPFNDYCGYDDGFDCAHCANVSSPVARGRRINMYVWVYEVARADGKVDEVNAPRVLRVGSGKGQYITNLFVSYVKKYGTLTDRDFEWRRTGGGVENTTYSLIPEDKGPAPKELNDALSKLPDLEAVARDMPVEWPWKPAKEEPKETEKVVKRPAPTATKSLLEKLRENKDTKTKAPIGEDI